MNHPTRAVLLLTALLLNTSAATADQRASDAFAKLKGLAGQWQGKNTKGEPATLTITVGAGGHAVLDDYRSGAHGQLAMYTVYHLDGDHLMLAHYCVSKNQPRMRANWATSTDANSVRFEFLDATNLQDPNAGHMYQAEIHFGDQNQFSSDWSYRVNGKHAFTETTVWERVPAAPATSP